MLLWKKISDVIDKVVDTIGSIAVLMTIVCTSINIFSRWFIGRSLGQLDEISLIAFVWAIYIGMGTLFNTGEHICMDFIVNRLPRIPRIILTVINYVIEMGIAVLVTVLAVELMGRSFIRTTNVVHLPYAYLQLAIAVGFCLFAINVLRKLIDMFIDIVHKRDPFAQPLTTEGEDE